MRRLTKAELIDRIAARANARYGSEFGEALFNDLLKDDLLPPALRSANVGKHPVYSYGCRTYRRALQILRLRASGFRGRDALRIQLFLRGYGRLSPLAVRASLWNEYRKQGKALLAQVRSTYADNKKPIPRQRKKSLMGEMGQLDNRFEKAGLRLANEDYIALLRTARQDPIDVKSLVPVFPSLISGGSFGIQEIAVQLPNLFSGLLMLENASSTDDSTEADSPEALIKNATAASLLDARQIYRVLVQGGFRRGVNSMAEASPAAARDPAAEVLELSAKNDPKFTVVVFIICLVLVSQQSQV